MFNNLLAVVFACTTLLISSTGNCQDTLDVFIHVGFGSSQGKNFSQFTANMDKLDLGAKKKFPSVNFALACRLNRFKNKHWHAIVLHQGFSRHKSSKEQKYRASNYNVGFGYDLLSSSSFRLIPNITAVGGNVKFTDTSTGTKTVFINRINGIGAGGIVTFSKNRFSILLNGQYIHDYSDPIWERKKGSADISLEDIRFSGLQFSLNLAFKLSP